MHHLLEQLNPGMRSTICRLDGRIPEIGFEHGDTGVCHPTLRGAQRRKRGSLLLPRHNHDFLAVHVADDGALLPGLHHLLALAIALLKLVQLWNCPLRCPAATTFLELQRLQPHPDASGKLGLILAEFPSEGDDARPLPGCVFQFAWA